MELLNAVSRFADDSAQGRAVLQEALDTAVLLLAPITPHVCDQLWQALGHAGAVIDANWPQVDERALVSDSIALVVQVNGKLRGRIEVDAAADKDAILAQAKADENVKRHLEGMTLRKEIYVPGKLVNLVVG